MSGTIRSGWPRPGPNPTLFSLFGKGYLAITFDHPVIDERYQGIVPLEGESLARAAESFFAQSEQIPSIVRLAAEKRGERLERGGPAVPASAGGRRGRDRLHTRLDHPDWPHVAILAGSVKPEELTDPGCRSTTSRGGCSTRRRRSGPWSRLRSSGAAAATRNMSGR
jgi:redox-regulated HSP33 family molecular chaperone